MQLESALKPSEAEYVRLIKRAAELVGCARNSPEETELAAIAAKLDASRQRTALDDQLAPRRWRGRTRVSALKQSSSAEMTLEKLASLRSAEQPSTVNVFRFAHDGNNCTPSDSKESEVRG